MSDRLFGTDGVRGCAGRYPLDSRTVRRLGAALVRALPESTRAPRVLVGRDTRESGESIEEDLAGGIRSQGASIASAGVISTPAIAFLTKAMAFDAGLVISASHNLYQDNGIKVFSGAGEKLTESLERKVEALVADASWTVPDGRAAPVPASDLVGPYLAHVRRALPDRDELGDVRLVIDCANGAACALAPRFFESLGFDVRLLHCSPDGRNINCACGSTRPESLARAVVDERARLGIAFDGDGDRAIFVDHLGRVIDGDAVMMLCARYLKDAGRLRGNAIVATVMSNLGLEVGLRSLGIDVVRCQVGDKYVMEEMLKRDLALGGEQSGHVIFSDFLFTGDGLITAAHVLQVMAATGRELSDLASDLTIFPQVLLNVPVRRKIPLRELPEVTAAIEQVEQRLGDSGRLLVRYSGTEPLLRVMLEGRDRGEILSLGQKIVDLAKVHLG